MLQTQSTTMKAMYQKALLFALIVWATAALILIAANLQALNSSTSSNIVKLLLTRQLPASYRRRPKDGVRIRIAFSKNSTHYSSDALAEHPACAFFRSNSHAHQVGASEVATARVKFCSNCIMCATTALRQLQRVAESPSLAQARILRYQCHKLRGQRFWRPSMA